MNLFNRHFGHRIRYLMILAYLPVFLFSGCAVQQKATCKHPAPLHGVYDARAPGYIIYFNKIYDEQARQEANRLAAKYQFRILKVFTGIGGFYADFDRATLAQLRCEPTVERILFDEIMDKQPVRL